MNNRRKNYFINKEFQTSFFIKFFALLLIEAFLIAALFMFIAEGTLTTAYQGTALTIQKTGAYFFMKFILITIIVGGAIGASGILIFMYLSHRIGGPLYKFEKVIGYASKGDFTQRISLRKTDQLIELKDKTNILLAEIDARISDIKKDVDEACEPGNNVSRQKELFEKIRSTLSYFNTSK